MLTHIPFGETFGVVNCV